MVYGSLSLSYVAPQAAEGETITQTLLTLEWMKMAFLLLLFCCYTVQAPRSSARITYIHHQESVHQVPPDNFLICLYLCVKGAVWRRQRMVASKCKPWVIVVLYVTRTHILSQEVLHVIMGRGSPAYYQPGEQRVTFKWLSPAHCKAPPFTFSTMSPQDSAV